MKKIITFLLMIVVLSAMLVPASAATEEELMEEFKKASISKHLLTEVENLAATYDVTEEQGDALMELIKKVSAAFPEDKGPGYHNPDGYEDYFGEVQRPYTEEQLNILMDAVADACEIVGFTYEFVPSEDPKHKADVTFVARDKDGRIAFQYDGDVIKKLGEIDGQKESNVPYLVGGIGILALAGIAIPVLKLKKKEEDK